MTITDAMVEKAGYAFHKIMESGAVSVPAAMRAALEAAIRPNVDMTFLGSAEADKAADEAIRNDKIRVALEKARRLHQIDCADHNVGLFIDEALSWLPQKEDKDDTHGFVDGEKNL